MLPIFMTLKITRENGKGFGLWIPVFILWPLIILILMFLAPLALAAQIFLSSRGIKPFSILFVCLELLGSVRGTSINLFSKEAGNKTAVKVTIT